MNFQCNLDFARQLDKSDEFAPFRNEFCFPSLKKIKQVSNKSNGLHDSDCNDLVYFAGNSLGLMAKRSSDYVNRELTKWSDIGVLGHEKGELPWVSCENYTVKYLADLLGCAEDEVVCMNNLTSNMHLLLSSFYRPTSDRFKLAIEGGAFPSDHYAVENHCEMHGFDPKNAMLIFKPREGEDLLRMDDILATIEREGPKLSCIFMSAIHFRTGQYFDIEKIVQAGHKVGAFVGIDLAHAIGNVPLYLDRWNVDFACACTYKYLNSGAGGIGVAYINRRHFDRQPRLIGWFAHRLETRFVMDNQIEYDKGAAGFKTGNQSPLLCASLLGSLELFEKAGGIAKLRNKSLKLTAYLEWLINKSPLFEDLRGITILNF